MNMIYQTARHIVLDLAHPVMLDGLVSGRPGDWRTMKSFCIQLGTKRFDGADGHGWCVVASMLCVTPGVAWDGSSVVPDTSACVLPSMVHDLLCGWVEANRKSIGWWRCFWRRRLLDKMYSSMAMAQGMSRARAKIRFAGLRMFGPFYTLLTRIFGKGR